MTRGEMKHYLKVIRKEYKNIFLPLGLANFVGIALICLFAFLLLAYEPASAWHDTDFTLARLEYRYARGGGVLELYTTDNRRYVLNHNEAEIRNLLEQGRQYRAVYSDDLFHDVIKGLEDDEREYLNADEMRKAHEAERFWFRTLLALCGVLLLVINGLYVLHSVKEEKRRTQRCLRKRT